VVSTEQKRAEIRQAQSSEIK